MARLFASLAGVAEARVRLAARHARRRALLIALCVLFGLLAAGYALAAATTALAAELGLAPALLLMAGLALIGVLVLLAVLAADTREARRQAVRRAGLDRELARAALRSTALPRGPSRGVLGLMLVAAGALLVLRGRDDD